MTSQIEKKLRAAFDPDVLIVRDDSEAHRGHSGYREGGESHFHVTLRAKAFDGLSRVARQRAVHAVLTEELKAQIHALSLTIEGATD